MTFLKHIETRLKSLGVECSISNDVIVIPTDDRTAKLRLEDGWEDAYRQYRQARSLEFDAQARTLVHNKSVEYVLIRLAPGMPLIDNYELRDPTGNVVSIGSASMTFALAFFDSPEYEAYFKARLERRLPSITSRRVSFLMWQPTTATYIAKGRKTPANLKEVGAGVIKRCLFKISVEKDDCFSVWSPNNRRLSTNYLEDYEEDETIPRSEYDENVVSYYKVAKASPFPSQSFLAYYNVLEYHFLRVAEDLLHHRLTAMLNDPRFRPSKDSLDKVISAVRGQDAKNDETDMLRNVLYRYVQESDLIEFLNRVEDKVGEKIYTKKRTIFGEQLEISPREGHALSNSANALKHIRNAIVHSSDRYSREECHIPLSQSEGTVEEFIPLVRFFAEKVIYGTAG